MNFSDVLSKTFCESTILGTLGFGAGFIVGEIDHFDARVWGKPASSQINPYHCGLALAISSIAFIVLTNFIKYRFRHDPNGPDALGLHSATILAVGVGSAFAWHKVGLISTSFALAQIVLSSVLALGFSTSALVLATRRWYNPPQARVIPVVANQQQQNNAPQAQAVP